MRALRRAFSQLFWGSDRRVLGLRKANLTIEHVLRSHNSERVLNSPSLTAALRLVGRLVDVRSGSK
jgi:hypothetical protein